VLAARLIGIHPALILRHAAERDRSDAGDRDHQPALGHHRGDAPFLGLGLPSTQPSLGTLIQIGQKYLFAGEWWIAIFPGIAPAALVLVVNLLGDWLRDALNPRLR
jgi:peptide/nickel transport system permease protein